MATNTEPTWRAGEVVGGRYRLLELIGSGGMSVVWRAHDDVLDRPVAVKMLSKAGSERFRIQLRAEARAYGRLNTPRIAQVYDYGETDAATPYLVMEYVTGEPLSHRLRDGAMSWAAAIAMAAQIADALRDAYAHGLVHRDIKPDNVILTEGGAKLVDFGICAMIGAPDADADGRLLGTPAYLAPERIADAPVQPAADVYGLGVLLYRALTGRLPWSADTSTGLIRAHMFAEPIPMPAIDELPPDVARICAACLDKDPHARPSGAEVANTLWLAMLTGNAPISPAPAIFANTTPTWPGPASQARASPRAGAARTAVASEPTEAVAGTSAIQPGAEQPTGRHRAYVFTAAIMTTSLALLGVAWGALGRGDDSGATYAGASPCFADFTVDRDWGSGFSGHVTVTNASDIALRGWRLEFAFPGRQHLSPPSATTGGTKADAMTSSAGRVTVTPTEGRPYAAAITQTGTTVVAQTVGAQTLAVSQSVVVPIQADYAGMNRIPTAVALNGTDCQTHASTPTPATTRTATADPTQTATATSAKAESTSSGTSGSSGSTGKGGEDGKGKDHGGHGKSDGSSGKG
jgi:eukaryotic-like serine/threonine-protein kinase